ncbi:MAG: ParA family protein [Hyphomicrobiaceae bacterium]|nr:ParA family protein [Hyphomicrobiaceae bacterium]
MRNTIAVMNTKGGVGKSTIVLAVAETLAAWHGKNVLVIDSDAQASVSSMLMATTSLRKLQGDGRTIVDYLVSAVLRDTEIEWSDFVVGGVSDVDDAKTVYLMPSDMQLTLFEREVSKEALHGRLRTAIGQLLARARLVFDVVLVDCPPGLSVLTECWLREADYHVSPTKPDYISVCGLDVFRRFRELNPEMGFAENLGVLVNMKERQSAEDEAYHRWLADNRENRCFEQVLPRLNALQQAARYSPEERSFGAKYPGEIGTAVRNLTVEILGRLAEGASKPASRPAPARATPEAPPPDSIAHSLAAASAPAAPPHARPDAGPPPVAPAADAAAAPATVIAEPPRPDPTASQSPPAPATAPTSPT